MIPIYVSLMGVDNYGLVGLYITAQGLIVLFEGGLGASVGRELIRMANQPDQTQEIDRLILMVDRLFLIASSVLVLITVSVIYALPDSILYNINSLLTPTDAALMVGAVVARLPLTCYQNILIGTNRQSLLNWLLVLTEALRHVLGASSIFFFEPTPTHFFLAQFAASVVIVSLFRSQALATSLGSFKIYQMNISRLISILPFAGMMTTISISWFIVVSVDKPILSSVLDPRDFGIYVVASQLGMSIFSLFYPIFNSYFPQFTSSVMRGDVRQSRHLLSSGSAIVTSAAASMLVTYWAYGAELVSIMFSGESGSPLIAEILLPMVVAAACHGIWLIPYAFVLSQRKVTTVIALNFAASGMFILALPYVARLPHGLVWVSWCWASVFILYGLIIGPILTRRHLGHGTTDVFRQGVFYPLVGIGILGAFIVPNSPSGLSPGLTIFVSMCIGLVHFVLGINMTAAGRSRSYRVFASVRTVLGRLYREM